MEDNKGTIEKVDEVKGRLNRVQLIKCDFMTNCCKRLQIVVMSCVVNPQTAIGGGVELVVVDTAGNFV